MLTGRVTAPPRDAWNGFGAYAEEVPDFGAPVAGTRLLPRKAGFL